MEIIEDEAEIVREIFDRYLKGEGPSPIAAELHRRGIKTAHGKEWNAGSVRALLDSRHVAGIRMHRGVEIGPGNWPAIIDSGTWEEVRARREYRSAEGRQDSVKKRFYLLRGLVMCSRCGTLMSGSKKRPTANYVCNRHGRNGDQKCSRSIGAESLEGFVIDAAINLLGKLRVDGRLAASNIPETAAESIEADQQQLAELNEMWTAKEISTAEYRKMRKEIQGRIAKAQRKVVVRPMVLLDGLTGEGAREAWFADDMTDERRNAVLRFLFSAVLIDAPTKLGRYMDWERIRIEQNPL
jgi:hypothetical protein